MPTHWWRLRKVESRGRVRVQVPRNVDVGAGFRRLFLTMSILVHVVASRGWQLRIHAPGSQVVIRTKAACLTACWILWVSQISISPFMPRASRARASQMQPKGHCHTPACLAHVSVIHLLWLSNKMCRLPIPTSAAALQPVHLDMVEMCFMFAMSPSLSTFLQILASETRHATS